MSAIHFFANASELPSQDSFTAGGASPGQFAYGPVSGTETTLYRVTSLFTGTALASNPNPMSHAVMAGRIFIVDNDNTTGNARVNLILKPDFNLAGMPAVKYFIYRGLLKSDFLGPAPTYTTVRPAAADDSSLIKKIRNASAGSMDALRTFSNSGTEVFDTYQLDKIFLVDGRNFQTVVQGESLGRFDGLSTFKYGFEIVLDEPGAAPTVADTRKEKLEFDLTHLVEPQLTERRLQVLNYIDPAAFFAHINRCPEVTYNDDKTIKSYDLVYDAVELKYYQGATLNTKSYYHLDLYANVLAKFYTRERIYLDIRDEDQMPLPFNTAYGYGADIKMTKDGSTASSSTATETYATRDWPIKIVETSTGFGTPGSENSRHKPGSSWINIEFRYHKLNISLPLGTNTGPSVHLHHGYWRTFLPFYLLEGKPVRMRQVGADVAPNNTWLNDLELGVPVAADGANNRTFTGYIRLTYTRIGNILEFQDQLTDGFHYDPTAPAWAGKLDASAVYSPDAAEFTASGYTTSINVCRNHKYTANRGAGYIHWNGISTDKCGAVFFSVRSADLFKVHNYTEIHGHAITTKRKRNTNGEVISTYVTNENDQRTLYNVRDTYRTDDVSFYKYLRDRESKYDPLHSDKTFNTYVVEVETGVYCLEHRILDPATIRGRQLHAFEPMISIAVGATQRASIMTLFSSFSDAGPKILRVVPATLVPTPSQRDYLEGTLEIYGVQYSGGNFQWAAISTGITVVSLDGYHYNSHTYAQQFQTLAGGTVWNRDLAPSVTHFSAAVQVQLTTQLNAIGAVDKRLLLGEVRDYFYEGNLDYLTFEIAFRLPFHSIKTKPQFSLSGSNHSLGEYLYLTAGNNPYLDNFNATGGSVISWFNVANALRTLGGLTALTPPGYTSTTDALALDDDTFYSLMFRQKTWSIAQVNNLKSLYPEFAGIPSYFARTMEDENPLKRTAPGSMSVPGPHVPGTPATDTITLIVDTNPGTPRDDLQPLVTAGVISAATSTALKGLGNAVFGYTTITRAAAAAVNVTISAIAHTIKLKAGDTFITKASSATAGTQTTFTLYHNPRGHAGASSITVCFGIDLGQQNWKAFSTYTQYNNAFPGVTLAAGENWQTILADSITEVSSKGVTTVRTKEHIVKVILGGDADGARQKESAVAYLKAFKTVIWDNLTTDVHHGIKYTRTFMAENYALKALEHVYTDAPATRKFLKVYRTAISGTTAIPFYDAGGQRFMNEVEAFCFVTMAYNGGKESNFNVTGSSRTPRLFIHAVNSHDIRWMREVIKQASLYGGRATIMLNHLADKNVIKEYRR
jgi:hypothetical protein